MDFAEAFKYIEPITFIEPCELVLEKINAAIDQNLAGTKRRINLSDIKREGDLCVWCGKGELKKKQQKYCSEPCKESALMFCNPQCNTTRAWVLINLQSCCCKACGLCYEDFFIKKVKHKIRLHEKWKLERGYEWDWDYGDLKKPTLSYFLAGGGLGSLMHVDHIIPIFKGGAGVGFDNIQVICAGCHQQKTASER